MVLKANAFALVGISPFRMLGVELRLNDISAMKYFVTHRKQLDVSFRQYYAKVVKSIPQSVLIRQCKPSADSFLNNLQLTLIKIVFIAFEYLFNSPHKLLTNGFWQQ